MTLGLNDITVTGGSTAMVPTKTSLSVVSSLNDTLTSPCSRDGTVHSTRPSPTTAATTTAESLRSGCPRITHTTSSSARKTSLVAMTTFADTPLETKGVASLNSAEGTAVKLRAGAVAGLNSSREAPSPGWCNATDINRMEFNPRTDAMHDPAFSAHTPFEHTLCTARPQTSIVAMLTSAVPSVVLTFTCSTLSTAANNEAELGMSTNGAWPPLLQSN
jgi:hypothetical protein